VNQPMMIVEEARERILTAFHQLEAEEIDLLDALGRILAEDIVANESIPPYANSSMDGYAVRSDDTVGADADTPVSLAVLGEVAAGHVPEVEVEPGTAVRIMTGAPLPPGADAVVKVEDTRSADGEVDVLASAPEGQYVRPAGEDVEQGSHVLSAGTRLGPAHLGMLATLGVPTVRVTRRPRVAILATGDELLEIDQPLAPGKIRNANTYSNAAQVLTVGGEPILLGIARDRVDDLTDKIRAGLEQDVDLFLSSGGVSMGEFDLVKDVLEAEGAIDFWKVRMKPGKPLAFGQIEGVPFLGLPGNPVSVMVSFEMFVRPSLLKMLGATGEERPRIEATLADPIPYKDNRRHYVRVRVNRPATGTAQAHLTGGQGSGILSSMVKANGLAIIPEDWDHAPTGVPVEVILLDSA